MKPAPESFASKAALRAGALARRAAITPEARTTAALAVAALAASIIAATRPRFIATYIPIRGEIDPGVLQYDALKAGAQLALPVTDTVAGMLSFRRWTPGDPVIPGLFGIPEPAPRAESVVPDLILLPLAAFDRSGHRIGYGRGYYDRAIAALRAAGAAPKLLGLAFSVQEVAAVPAEPHDVALDWVVTELGIAAGAAPAET